MLCPTWLSVALLSVAEPVSSNMSARRQNPPTRPPTIGSSWPTAMLKSECINVRFRSRPTRLFEFSQAAEIPTKIPVEYQALRLGLRNAAWNSSRETMWARSSCALARN